MSQLYNEKKAKLAIEVYQMQKRAALLKTLIVFVTEINSMLP